jgi:DNA-binding transcriptional regulator WhiA
MTSRGMYDELMKETMGSMVLNGLQKELMNQRKLAEDFITDFINGKISYKEYKEQVKIKLKKILKEGPFTDIKNQFKLRRKEIESKIPYMLVKDKINKILSDLKTIQASSVFGKINVITINKDTLKNNLRPNNKHGKYYSKEILGDIGGSLFDRTYLNEK